MTSYRGLLNKIEAFCYAHFQIKKYAGEFKEQMPNFSTQDEKFPIVYVVPSGDLSDLNTNQFTLDIYCVDIIQKDRANINTIISDCNLIVNDLYLYFLDGNDLSIDVIGASAGTPINNFDLDYSAGWVKTITFEVQSYSVCAIPMSPINPNPPVTCDPATYRLLDTLDNVLASGSINSGANADIVVQDSIIKNSDESYLVSLPAESTLNLDDIKVTDSDGTAYSFPSMKDVICTYVPPCEDASYTLKNTNSQVLESGSIPSGGSLDITAPDASYVVTDSANVPLHSGNIPSNTSTAIVVQDATVINSDASYSASIVAEGSLTLPDISVSVENTLAQVVDSTVSPSVQDVVLVAPDAHINIKKTGDGTITTVTIPSGTSTNYDVADNAITVNGSSGFTIDATDPLDIVLKDGTGTTVTPTSVTPNAGSHKVDIVLPSSVTPIDSDAQAFLTATSITDATITSAIQHLVIDLKNGGVWTKLKALYPFVGGTASTHKFNLKNPLDTNAAFRLTFGGGWTHSATGAKPNGTNAYADTHLIPSTHIASIDDFSFGVYLRDNVDELKTDIGCSETYNNYMLCRYAGSTYFTFGGSTLINFATSNSQGLIMANKRNSTNAQGYQNITKRVDSTNYNAFRGLATCSIYLGAQNSSGTGGQFSSKEQACAFIGLGLTDIEVSYLYSAIQLFNNRLSRAV